MVGFEIDLNTIDGGVVLGAVRLGDVVVDVSRGFPAVSVHKAGDHNRKFTMCCTAVKFNKFKRIM